ncbi:MAG: type II toxin-antitoxin system VapC family toxin [Arachnia sp.]
MIALDTNVLARYLTQDDPDQAQRATAIMDGLTVSSPGFVATIVWAELHWVLTRAYGFAPREVVERISDLALADEIRPEEPAAIAGAVSAARKGADFADALIGEAATAVGCDAIVTFDKRAAAKLGWRLA